MVLNIKKKWLGSLKGCRLIGSNAAAAANNPDNPNNLGGLSAAAADASIRVSLARPLTNFPLIANGIYNA